jgi:hypothetical protein
MSRLRRSRREVLQVLGGLTLAAGGAASTLACKKQPRHFSCVDSFALAPDDAHARTTLAYQEPAVDTTRTCATCQQYVLPANDECGSCKVLKGPVHPDGTCKVFSAKPA